VMVAVYRIPVVYEYHFGVSPCALYNVAKLVFMRLYFFLQSGCVVRHSVSSAPIAV